MQKRTEECKKNVKETITTFCKLLSALDVESIPTAEVFRKAKFNKAEAVQDLWCLLSSLLKKVFEPACACAELTKRPTDTQIHFVKCALWHSGYGGWWLFQSHGAEIGSTDLLLAFSWIIASGNILECLLRERLLQLDVLSSAAVGLPQQLELNMNGCDEDDIRRLQWHYGKLKLQWRSLFTAQQQQSKVTDQVCYYISSSPVSDPSTASVPDRTGPSALDKDLERILSLNKILELYLEWKNVEPMFWCWMDSVIDRYLSDGSAEMKIKQQVVAQHCCYGDKFTRPVRQLDKMLLKLQTTRPDRPIRSDTTRLNHRQKEVVERRVTEHLQGFSLINTLTATERGFTPYFHKPQVSGSTSKPPRDHSAQAQSAVTVSATSALTELRNRKSVLEWKMELLRQSCREDVQLKANTLQGLVFILPLKR